MSEARDLFSAMDPEKPGTVNAVLVYMAERLDRGECPMCSGVIRKTLVKGVLVWACLSCTLIVPMLPPPQAEDVSPGARAEVARVLFQVWELAHD